MADFTQAQLDALNKSIAEGTLEVRYQDKKVVYRSLDEMMRIRDVIKAELASDSESQAVRVNYQMKGQI